MQTPKELLKAEVAGASDIQQGIRTHTPERKTRHVQVAVDCALLEVKHIAVHAGAPDK